MEKFTKIPYTVLLTAFGIVCDTVLEESIFDTASDSWEAVDGNVLLAIFIVPLVFESALKVIFFLRERSIRSFYLQL